MALTRISFNDGSGYYVVPINPLEYESQDSDEVVVNQTLDGSTIEQLSFFDSRVRTFTWRNLPQADPYIAMVNRLKGYKNVGVILLKLSTLNFDSSVETSIKIVNVTTKIRPGAGPSRSPYKMAWEEITVDWIMVRV